jgi:hypothetical protein
MPFCFTNLKLWLLFWFNIVKVELIGYAASDAELFVIYEYAQKGSLRSHLHDPQNKGKKLQPYNFWMVLIS